MRVQRREAGTLDLKRAVDEGVWSLAATLPELKSTHRLVSQSLADSEAESQAP